MSVAKNHCDGQNAGKVCAIARRSSRNAPAQAQQRLNPERRQMKHSDEIEALVNQMFNYMRAGDGEAVGELIADDDDVLIVGTDTDEWWNSGSMAKQHIREQHEQAGGFDITVDVVNTYAHGDVGWF